MKNLLKIIVISLNVITPINKANKLQETNVITFNLAKFKMPKDSALQYTYEKGNLNYLSSIIINGTNESYPKLEIKESNYEETQNILCLNNDILTLTINTIDSANNYKVKINNIEQLQQTTANKITINTINISNWKYEDKQIIQIVKVNEEKDPYKDYTNFDINQSRLQVVRTNKSTFSSYNEITRFNNIDINNNEITINFQNYQYAKLNYTDKNITIPILGTFINNDTQLNIVDFYFTDKNNNVINLLNYISSADMWFGSPTRNVAQSIYTYKNSSFNYFNNSDIPYRLNYTKNSDNTIQITTNDVGISSVGNATIVNNENNFDNAFITSLFGIDPITISYFGMPNKNIINQLKSGGSISAIINQRVELANYNKYLPIYTYNPSIEQSKGELYIPLSNIPNNVNINIIAFRNDINDDIKININDITTLFSVLDNLENLGLTPFTFGTIIFIGLTLGFIMVLIKILK